MIQSVSVTPVWEEWKKFELKQVTGFEISIDCGIKEADEILNLLKEMAGRQYSTESEEEAYSQPHESNDCEYFPCHSVTDPDK